MREKGEGFTMNNQLVLPKPTTTPPNRMEEILGPNVSAQAQSARLRKWG